MNTIYIIAHNNVGGTNKFTTDLIKIFQNINFIFITNKNNLDKILPDSNVIVNNLTNTDIFIDDIILIKNMMGLKLYIILHDMFWLLNSQTKIIPLAVHNIYLKKDIFICEQVNTLFNLCEKIICPSLFVFNIYTKYFNKDKFIIVPHIDLKQNIKNFIPEIYDNTINIGCLNIYAYHKGSNLIQHIRDKFKFYKEYKINWIITGININIYNELEFFNCIVKYNLHCLTYLSIVGETWCYCLTKGLNSGLPLLYNNFGSFKERINEINEFNFKVYESEYEMDLDLNGHEQYIILEKKYIELLDFIILNNGKYDIPKYTYELEIHDFYKNLFN